MTRILIKRQIWKDLDPYKFGFDFEKCIKDHNLSEWMMDTDIYLFGTYKLMPTQDTREDPSDTYAYIAHDSKLAAEFLLRYG